MSTFNRHDQHYAMMDIEPVDVQEMILNTSSDKGMTPVRAHHVAVAVGYLLRSGAKVVGEQTSLEASMSDINKAINHLHRATTGHWIQTIIPLIEGDS